MNLNDVAELEMYAAEAGLFFDLWELHVIARGMQLPYAKTCIDTQAWSRYQ